MNILRLPVAFCIFCSLTTRHAEAVFRDDSINMESDTDAVNGVSLVGVQSKDSFSHNNSITQLGYSIKCAATKMVVCSTHCEHEKFYYSNDCCRCICRKNYLLVDSTKCREASWTNWSTWSSCLKTEWGGIQTKERSCQTEKTNAPGACSGRGSRARNCSPVTSSFRIRKNVHHLTDEEIHDLLQAMTKFKKDKTVTGYMNIVSWHGFPGRCPWYHDLKGHDDNHCSFHHHPLFLPWHRLITTQLELGLQKYLKNKTLGIPFWDWTEHSKDIPYLLRLPEIFDPILKKFFRNPFYRTLISNGHPKIYSHRSPWYPGVLDDNLLLKGTLRALFSHDYATFDTRLSMNPHDQIHDCFCSSRKITSTGENWCSYGMPTVTYASFDPAFLLHHSAMDRIFSMRRELEENAGVADWTESRIIAQFQKKRVGDRSTAMAFEWPLSPFCNKSMNSELTTLRNKVWTLQKSYYGSSLLGFKYTNFNLGNYTWKDLQKYFKRNNVFRKYWNDDLFIAKSGGLTSHFCKNYSYDNFSECQTSC